MLSVVYAYAKILILKQITTVEHDKEYDMGCICLCKDTNFKANHNHTKKYAHDGSVVYAYAKILILKQITTINNGNLNKKALYMPMQRY